MAGLGSRETFDATIAQTASASSAIALGNHQPAALVLPAAFEANTDAIYFQVSNDGTTYGYLKDKDGDYEYVTVAAANGNRMVHLDPSVFVGWLFIKLVSYQVGVGVVAQTTAARAISLIGATIVV